MTDLDQSSTREGTRPRKGIQLFDQRDAVGLFDSGTMSFPEFDPGDMEQVAAEGLDISASGDGLEDQVLFRGADGFSLVRAVIGPHYVLPRHSHDSDCLYYVQEGSIAMGSRTVEAGSGFFVPGGAPYAYEAGPDGAVVLEFRQATSFDMKVPGGQVGRFRQMAEAGAAHGERWRADRADRAARRAAADAPA